MRKTTGISVTIIGLAILFAACVRTTQPAAVPSATPNIEATVEVQVEASPQTDTRVATSNESSATTKPLPSPSPIEMRTDTSPPVSAPTPESSMEKYVNQVDDFSENHLQTLIEINSTIKRLAGESTVKVNFGKQSLSGLLNINPSALSAEELVQSLVELRQLSKEEQAELSADKADLDSLLTKVKQDQIELLRIVPPEGVTIRFHQQALAAIDHETAILIELINFYSSPGLQSKTSEFDRFPSVFADARSRLRLANQRWNNAEASAQMLESP